jgi:acetylornithine/N-succinyldiaminopimelate aminotransferase
VVSYLIEHDIENHVKQMSTYVLEQLHQWQQQFPELIADVRGQGLLIAVELSDPEVASEIYVQSRENGLLLNLKHGTVLRLFPALNITRVEIDEGLSILHTLLKKNYKN